MNDFANRKLILTLKLAIALACSITLAACSSSDSPEPSAPPLQNADAFDLARTSNAEINLTEGSSNNAVIPLTITRTSDNNAPITLSAAGLSEADSRRMSYAFSASTIEGGNTDSNLVISLGIDALPIQPQQRRIIVTASDSVNIEQVEVVVNIQPTSAPDIYLLVGQSNMVGFSGDGTKQAFPGGLDETNPRIRQLNVTYNDEFNQFIDAASFRSDNRNVLNPAIITAEDPLHQPLNATTNTKDGDYIGMGLSFAKAALPNTNANIVLVPAAWSGSAFCDNNGGPSGQWNADLTGEPALGNTWLFDRAVTRTNIAINRTGGVLRGILWHQGESDANNNCAPLYLANLERLAQQFRQRIQEDSRGAEYRRSGSPIPFILGTMSRGFDDRGDLSVFSADKQVIDNSHRQLPSQIPFVATVVNDDLAGPQWPCGNDSCIHFGPEALREMGNRYYQLLRSTLNEGL